MGMKVGVYKGAPLYRIRLQPYRCTCVRLKGNVMFGNISIHFPERFVGVAFVC